MKTLTALTLSVLLAIVLHLAFAPPAYAVRCFHKGEKIDGRYKICYYDCLGDEVAITIASTKLCPLTITR